MPAPRAFVGTTEQVADQIQRWIEHGGAEGFNFFEALPNTSRKDFVALVVPLLQARGFTAWNTCQDMLPDNLELPVPVNRYAEVEETGQEVTACSF